MKTTLQNKIALAVVTSCVLLVTITMLGQGNTHPAAVVPRINMDEVPLQDAIKILAKQSDLNFILDLRVHSGASGRTVTFTWENISAEDALRRVLKERNLVLIENPATSVARIVPANLGIKPVDRALVSNDTNAVVPVIMMNSVPFEDAVQSFASQLHMKITIDEKAMRGPTGEPVTLPLVTVRWKQLTAEQALVALLDNYDLIMVEDAAGSTARVTVKEKLEPSGKPRRTGN